MPAIDQQFPFAGGKQIAGTARHLIEGDVDSTRNVTGREFTFAAHVENLRPLTTLDPLRQFDRIDRISAAAPDQHEQTWGPGERPDDELQCVPLTLARQTPPQTLPDERKRGPSGTRGQRSTE